MMVSHAKAVVAFKDGGYKGQIGIIHSLETKYPYDENVEADHKVAKTDDILANQFVLDATFLGDYTAETLETIQYLASINGGEFIPLPKDIEVMKKAAPLTDY